MNQLWDDTANATPGNAAITAANVNDEDAYGRRPLAIATLKAYPSEVVIDELMAMGAKIDFYVAGASAGGKTLIESLEGMAAPSDLQKKLAVTFRANSNAIASQSSLQQTTPAALTGGQSNLQKAP